MKIRKEVRVERRPGGRTRLFDPRSGAVFALNGCGDALAELLERGATREQLRAALVERFEVAPWVAATDVELFLQTLEHHGLLES